MVSDRAVEAAQYLQVFHCAVWTRTWWDAAMGEAAKHATR